jgi:hypothetical protein
MIRIIYPGGEECPDALTFEEMQKLVGGYVECNHTRLGDEIVQAICNEDGIALGLPFNPRAQAIFGDKFLMPPQGALGTWIILSGKDMLT